MSTQTKQSTNSSNPSLDILLLQLAEKYSISKTFLAGERIFEEGESGNTMLLILSGTVKVIKKSSVDGMPVQIATRGAGAFLGEMAIVEQSPRSATVVAETNCQVLLFSKENFEKIISEQPALATRVLRSLSRKLRESDYNRISELEANNRRLNEYNRELIRLNTFLDYVIDQSPSAVLLVRRSGEIYRMNKAALRMFHIKNSDESLRIDDLFVDFNIGHLVPDADTTWHGEVSARCGQETFPAYMSITSLSGHVDRLLHMVICQDISELQALNRTIAEFEKYTSAQETAVELAHDLKNLLGVLLGNMELVLMKLSEKQRQSLQRSIEAIEKSSKETLEFVENIMAYREDPAGYKEVDVRAMVKAIVRYCSSQGRFRGIQLDYHVDKAFPARMQIKEGQIQSVIVNLLINAADALVECPGIPEKRIRVSLLPGESKKMAIIRVSDNGPGINPDHLPLLFVERFTTKSDGHGIGLVSSGKIVQKHGGEISADTEIGRGTTFTIRLPLSREPEHA